MRAQENTQKVTAQTAIFFRYTSSALFELPINLEIKK